MRFPWYSPACVGSRPSRHRRGAPRRRGVPDAADRQPRCGAEQVARRGLWVVRRTHVRYERLVELGRLPTCPHVITDALANRSNDAIIEASGKDVSTQGDVAEV